MGWILFLVLVVGVLWMLVDNANKAEKQKEEARRRYVASLAELKQNPGNSDLRQKTLGLGRAYSHLIRDKKGNTVFDEVALMNDINAACAATQQAISSPRPSEGVVDRLRKLQDLKSQGLIDEADFLKKKQEILAEV